MATHHGNAGAVQIATSTAVGEVTEFQVEESADTVNDNAMGDAWKTHLSGKKSWTASISANLDETDAGQTGLAIGSSVTLKLYPEGAGSGATYCSGTATVTKKSVSTPQDGVVSVSFDAEGNGALTWSTV